MVAVADAPVELQDMAPAMESAFFAEEVEIVDRQQFYSRPVATSQMILLVGGVPEVDVTRQPSEVFALPAATDIAYMGTKCTDEAVGQDINETHVVGPGLGQQGGIATGYLAEPVDILEMREVDHYRFLH